MDYDGEWFLQSVATCKAKGGEMPEKSSKCMFFSGINLDFVIKAQPLVFHR